MSLLRPLLKFPFEFFDLPLRVGQLLVFLKVLQMVFVLESFSDGFLDVLPLFGHLPSNFQFQRLLPVFKFPLFLQKLKLLLPAVLNRIRLTELVPM